MNHAVPPRNPAFAATQAGDAFRCDVCGAPAFERNCKIVCGRCGYTRDCSDP